MLIHLQLLITLAQFPSATLASLLVPGTLGVFLLGPPLSTRHSQGSLWHHPGLCFKAIFSVRPSLTSFPSSLIHFSLGTYYQHTGFFVYCLSPEELEFETTVFTSVSPAPGTVPGKYQVLNEQLLNKRLGEELWRVRGWAEFGSIWRGGTDDGFRWENASGKFRDGNFLLKWRVWWWNGLKTRMAEFA